MPTPTSTTATQFFSEYALKACRSTEQKKQPAPHQKAVLSALDKWYANLRGEDDGGILVLPTGGGKTFTAVRFLCSGPLSDGYKVLWLAHTHHLLEQAFRTFAPEQLGHVREPRAALQLRVVSGTPGHFPPRDIKPTDDVVIATLQTVANAHRENLPQLRRFIESAEGKLFVVFDEAHHAPAPSYRKLMLDLRKTGAPALGLTATPTYADESKKGWLKKIFPQGILAQARIGELIADKILAKPTFVPTPTTVVPDFDDAAYQKWLGTYRDIPDDVVNDLARNAARNALIAETYARSRQKFGKTLIFTDRWYQCESIVEALEQRGVKAGAVYSHVDAQASSVEGRRSRDRDENARVLARFRNGEIDVLVNVKMLTEGTDLPDAQTVFLTRQTTSNILLTQMVGRALRGPKFGGTDQAYIVSFIDDWQQNIRWAEYDQLGEGGVDDIDRGAPKRPPLLLISIDLVKRLASQMNSGINITPGPFRSLMPAGWYRVTYDACVAGTDEIESRDQLVMVFDDEIEGFKKLIAGLVKEPPTVFESESVSFEKERPAIDALRARHLDSVGRAVSDVQFDIFHVARHIGQGHGAPQFYPFDVRDKHDLDAVVKEHRTRDLRLSEINPALMAEYANPSLFWRTLFPRFEQFRSYYEACMARAEIGSSVIEPPKPRTETPTLREPDEDVKDQVKRRDGGRCLACGGTRLLQVDHIISWHAGGPNHIDNLQTLCRTCNQKKAARTIRFTMRATALSSAPQALEHFANPDNPRDREHWERFLQRTLNFTYQCAAVSAITIGGRGDSYYNWTIDLVDGNSTKWLKPHLKGLFERVQTARAAAGAPAIASIRITSPGDEALRYPKA